MFMIYVSVFVCADAHSQVLQIAHQPRSVFFIQLFNLQLQLRVFSFHLLHLALGAREGLFGNHRCMQNLNMNIFLPFLTSYGNYFTIQVAKYESRIN